MKKLLATTLLFLSACLPAHAEEVYFCKMLPDIRLTMTELHQLN